jgi:hypothetical protein
MKKAVISIVLFLTVVTLIGQDITGTWNGILDVQGVQLRVDFHITATADGYTAKMDSPDQNAFGIPVTSTVFKKPDLTIKMTDLGAEYKGKLTSEELFEGTFTQMGQSFEMNLKKKKEDK